jgi:hypothetical protein
MRPHSSVPTSNPSLLLWGNPVPRLLFGALVFAALIPLALTGPVHAAMPTNDAVAAAAEAHGLTCPAPEDLGGGATFLLCTRDSTDPSTNIDLSVTYNAVSGEGGFAFATVAAYLNPPPSGWSELVTDVALLFCEAPADVVRAAVASQAPMTQLTGCSIRFTADDLGATYDVEAAPAPAAPVAGLGSEAADLAAYATEYGLECLDAMSGDVGEVSCFMHIDFDAGLAADYSLVVTSVDEEVQDAIAQVIGYSPDARWMPSDAGGFLRGAAARAAGSSDLDAVRNGLDEVITAGAGSFEAAGWRFDWTESTAEGARVWQIGIHGGEAATTPSPAAVAAPGEPAEGVNPAAPAPAEPFAASVPTPAEVSTDPIVILQSAALAALLVFLMPFPSQLFNSTLENHEDEVRRWLRMDRLGSLARGFGAFWASWPGVALFTLAAALLYGFLDPAFGFDVRSLAVFLGMLVGIVLVTVAFAVPAMLVHRRRGDRPTLKVVPISLLVGVGCVLVSRLTGFQPGYLYGLLIGLAFAQELSAAQEGRTTAITAGVMLVAALAAWLGLGLLPEGDAFGFVVARTSLAALMVAGLEGVVFGLLPLRFLPGEPLYAWNRVLWGGLLAIGAFAFFHILINPASGYLADTSRTPLFTVLALLMGFGLVSVAFWAFFRFRPIRSDAGPEASR